MCEQCTELRVAWDERPRPGPQAHTRLRAKDTGRPFGRDIALYALSAKTCGSLHRVGEEFFSGS